MKTKLWLFSLAIGLIFAACEKDDEFKGKPDGAGKGRVIATLESAPDACQITAGETPLIAGQHHEVGTVRVEHDGVNIVVTYETDPGWLITETHLHIGEDKDDFPLNKAGNPMIGLFMFGNDHVFKEVDGNKVIYTIPWDPGCYYIAAHAVVNGIADKDGKIDLEAFAEILPKTADVEVDHPTENVESYFNVHVREAGILNGEWPGWCIQTGAVIDPNAEDPYKTNVYSSYEDLSAYGYSAEFLLRVNWILNQNFTANGYTYGEVQIAIWSLLLGLDAFDYDALYATRPPDPLNPNVIGGYEEDKINAILDMAKNVTDFVPECGGVIAVVFVHDAQDLIIEYPVKCGEETAWGQGCRFVDRGNWAMYFKVCL